MSWSVVRGEPYPSQKNMDTILEEIVKEASASGPKTPQEVTLPQLLYHCLRKHPEDLFMINGTTGAKLSNRDILNGAVSLARALQAHGASGKVIMLAMRNHENAVIVFFAALFAGTIPFMMDPASTVLEFTHFLDLVEPCYIFCDTERKDDITAALKQSKFTDTNIIVCNAGQELKDFSDGHKSDNVFEIPTSNPDFGLMLTPTSGTTGMPKATMMTNRGLMIQIPMPWAHYKQIPRPTSLAMVLTTLQWMTFTMHVTSCPVYRIPLLLTPGFTTVEHVTHLLVTYRPTWTFFGPAFAKTLLQTATKETFSSLKTAMFLGAPSTVGLINDFKALLPADAQLVDGYGTTEMQGYIAVSDEGAPVRSCGPVLNIIHYKLVDEDGREVGLEAAGELHVKGECIFKTYYKNPDAYSECVVDGWLRTGDKFYIDKQERLTYVERMKFNFKYLGCQVSPEEVEQVVLSVPGVKACCVSGTESGPAVAIVPVPGADVSKEAVHQAVEVLSSHKRLHGGIAFVSSLPYSSNGKLKRNIVKKTIEQLQETGQCC